MATQDASPNTPWDGLLQKLWKDVPWSDARAVRDCLPASFDPLEHASMAVRLPGQNYSDEELSTALQGVIDHVLSDWRAAGESEPRDSAGHSIRQAVALMLARHAHLEESEVAQLTRGNYALAKLSSGSKVRMRQNAVGHLWGRSNIHNVQRSIRGALSRALVDLDRETPHPDLSYSVPSGYHRVTESEADTGFWWRDSTRSYINELGEQKSLNLLAGADGTSDVGEPAHATIAHVALIDWLKSDPEIAGLDDAERIAMDIANLFKGRSPSFVGSVMRGLAMQRHASREQLEQAMQMVTGNRHADGSLIGARHRPSFVSDAIVNLASEVVKAGHLATIVSAHNDGDIEEAIKASGRGSAITLYELHPSEGRMRRQNVLSEADLFVEREPKTNRRWVDFLTELLAKDRSLLVGTDVRSPGLAAALARSRTKGNRYALVIPDEHDLKAVPPTPETNPRRTLYYESLAGRYLDLGVAPIFVDFPAQVPQFLREVGLRLAAEMAGTRYQQYADRYDDWWTKFAPLFGFGELGSLDVRRQIFQSEWYRHLARLRFASEGQYDEPGAERLLYEVWIRRPRVDRELFLWATSDHFVTRTSTGRRVSLRSSDSIVQKAFREGVLREQTVTGRVPWKRSVAFPLTLEEAPYHGLMIGVMRIYSTTERGGQIHSMLSARTVMESQEEKMRAAIESLCTKFGEMLSAQPAEKIVLEKVMETDAGVQLGTEPVNAGD